MVDDFWALCAFKWRIVRLYIRFFFVLILPSLFFHMFVCICEWVRNVHTLCVVYIEHLLTISMQSFQVIQLIWNDI